METDILKEITSNNFLLVLMDERGYADKMGELVRSVHGKSGRICYICLSKPYTDVLEDLKGRGFAAEDFVFIDVLSAHYGPPPYVKNCIFISSPKDLAEIKAAVVEAVEKRGCITVVFDTISTLLIYEQSHSIVRFANSFISENKQETTKKLFIVLKEERHSEQDIRSLTGDLELLADRKIDMTAAGGAKKY
jgi:hypothetical protein